LPGRTGEQQTGESAGEVSQKATQMASSVNAGNRNVAIFAALAKCGEYARVAVNRPKWSGHFPRPASLMRRPQAVDQSQQNNPVAALAHRIDQPVGTSSRVWNSGKA